MGFAAETHDLEQYAKAKMQAKSLRMIAANHVDSNNLGFESDDNALSVFWKDGGKELPQARKSVLARRLMELIIDRLR